MALNTKFSLIGAIAACQTMVNLQNGATIKVYDGTQPATADTLVTTQVLLVTFTLSSPAFAALLSNIGAANSIPSAVAVATGIASWFRLATSGGTTLFDGSVGTGGTFNMVLNGTGIANGQSVSLSSYTFEVPLG